jgi:uncharacterized membrane protein
MQRAVVAGAFGLTVFAAASWARASCGPGEASAGYADAHHAFEEKRYDDSVAILRRVYACDANPVYLADIARALEEANRPRDAVAVWKDYLSVTVDAEERRRVEGRISALTKNVEEIARLERERQEADEARRRAEENARLAATAAVRLQPSTGSRPSPLGAWITTGVGAAGLVAGVVLGLDALATHSAAQRTPSNANQANQAAKTQGNAVDEAHAANWAFAIGGGIAAIGVTWAVIELVRPSPDVQAVGVAVRTDGVFLRASFR